MVRTRWRMIPGGECDHVQHCGGGGWPAAEDVLRGCGGSAAVHGVGVEPSLLMRLPFTRRHYAAAVEDRGQLLRLFDDLEGDPEARLHCPALLDTIRRAGCGSSLVADPGPP